MSYPDDITEQPAALRRLVAAYRQNPLQQPANLSDYSRVIVTGMGGSHFANHSLWRGLVAAGIRAEWTPTDELLSLPAPVHDGRVLVIAVSQSGFSGEVVTWVDSVATRADVDVIAVTNDPDSSLAAAAASVVLIHAGPEATVGTKTYLNTLGAERILLDALLGQPSGPSLDGLERTADGIERYLAETSIEDFAALLAADRTATAKLIVGRGAAYGTALQAALIVKEAAKVQYEGMSAGQFRHGPLDLADQNLLVWLLADGEYMADENKRLVDDLVQYGAAIFVTGAALDGATVIPAPIVPTGFEEFARILPVELANIPLAEARGFVPGEFRHNEKVTTTL